MGQANSRSTRRQFLAAMPAVAAIAAMGTLAVAAVQPSTVTDLAELLRIPGYITASARTPAEAIARLESAQRDFLAYPDPSDGEIDRLVLAAMDEAIRVLKAL